MPLQILTPSAAWSSQDITLGGIKYTFTYAFNKRDNRWSLSIHDSASNPVITGVKIMENSSLLARYRLDGFNHGDILCLRVLNTDDQVGRNNLGESLPYSLFYYTNDELAELL